MSVSKKNGYKETAVYKKNKILQNVLKVHVTILNIIYIPFHSPLAKRTNIDLTEDTDQIRFLAIDDYDTLVAPVSLSISCPFLWANLFRYLFSTKVSGEIN